MAQMPAKETARYFKFQRAPTIPARSVPAQADSQILPSQDTPLPQNPPAMGERHSCHPQQNPPAAPRSQPRGYIDSEIVFPSIRTSGLFQTRLGRPARAARSPLCQLRALSFSARTTNPHDQHLLSGSTTDRSQQASPKIRDIRRTALTIQNP